MLRSRAPTERNPGSWRCVVQIYKSTWLPAVIPGRITSSYQDPAEISDQHSPVLGSDDHLLLGSCSWRLVEYAECEFGRSAAVEFGHRQLKMNKRFLVVRAIGGCVKSVADAG